MPTYSFDPSTGEGYEVGRGGQPIEDPSAPSIEEVTEFRINEAARDYATRKQSQSQLTDSGNLEIEAKLLEVQQKLASDGLNPIERLQYEALANNMAAHLVGAQSAPQVEEPQQDVGWQSADEYKEELAQDPEVQTALNKASETFSEEVSEAFNEVLAEADELGTQSAMSAMQQITQNPDMVNRGEVTAFENNTKDQLSELVGSQLADEISTINLAVANGVVSKARAAKTVMGNPDLMSAMLKASAAGVIQLGL